jgi:head decoration protein D
VSNNDGDTVSLFLADPKQSGSFLISESNYLRSRDRAVIPALTGQLGFGTVLGKITASGKYILSSDSASDGSQIACAILWEDIDASGARDVIAGIVARSAEVFVGALTYDSSVDDDAKKAEKNAQLALVGIIVRETDDPAARALNNANEALGY